MVPTEVLMTFFPRQLSRSMLLSCFSLVHKEYDNLQGSAWEPNGREVLPLSGFSTSTTISIHSLFSFSRPSSPPMFNIFPHEREKTCTLQRIRDYLFIQLSPSPPITVVIQWESVIHCRKNSSPCTEHAAVSFIHCREGEIERKSHFALLEWPW
jgi:hypothetical protein